MRSRLLASVAGSSALLWLSGCSGHAGDGCGSDADCQQQTVCVNAVCQSDVGACTAPEVVR